MRHFVSTRRQFYSFGVNVLQIFCLQPPLICRIESVLDIVGRFPRGRFPESTTFKFDAYFEICKLSLHFTGCQLEGTIVRIWTACLHA